MSSINSVYDEAHVLINAVLDRKYNNPLGELPFGLLRKLQSHRSALKVLDIGCGRGESAIWWASQSRTQVIALDPSPAMLAEALQRAKRAGVAARIQFLPKRLEDLVGDEHFDLVLMHDVLCYLQNKQEQITAIAQLLQPGGFLSLTDYYAESSLPAVDQVCEAWHIKDPPSLSQIQQWPLLCGLQLQFLLNTSWHYRQHWLQLLEKFKQHREELLKSITIFAVEQYENQIGSILKAVETFAFGHFWLLLERPYLP